MSVSGDGDVVKFAAAQIAFNLALQRVLKELSPKIYRKFRTEVLVHAQLLDRTGEIAVADALRNLLQDERGASRGSPDLRVVEDNQDDDDRER
ncbi:MAG: hypothetical protein ACFB03_13375 [Paracoccaceae bacterium]